MTKVFIHLKAFNKSELTSTSEKRCEETVSPTRLDNLERNTSSPVNIGIGLIPIDIRGISGRPDCDPRLTEDQRSNQSELGPMLSNASMLFKPRDRLQTSLKKVQDFSKREFTL